MNGMDTEQVCAITMYVAAEMLAETIRKPIGNCLRAMADLVDRGWAPVRREVTP